MQNKIIEEYFELWRNEISHRQEELLLDNHTPRWGGDMIIQFFNKIFLSPSLLNFYYLSIKLTIIIK